ncbi:hypothetical protein B4N89_20135 [Embleya scabrispora]|uniref:Uncharacterized protein n=1 Tax=Embleya scabrispora TaxID=159449 RepID=A0A1T3P1E8_9ACTN|nr:hypothetical protein [Embleya scabrispora]OPC82936.1 hypothetical protein B4N89_20135 [Embleya scabrispora]
MGDGYGGGQGPGTGGAGYPFGPPGHPDPGGSRSRERLVLLAGVLGSALVVTAAVVTVLLLLDTGGDGARTPRGLPTAPAAARMSGPLAMPAAIEGRGPVARTELPPAVAELSATMARTFTDVRTEVFGGAQTRETVLLTLASRRETAPMAYVRDFVPAVATPEEAPVPGGPPGLLRCWHNPTTAMCLWGDEHDLIYVSDGAGTAHARLVIANVYAGTAR